MYIVIHRGTKHGMAWINSTHRYYVYDNLDNTIETCKGEDILLLLKNNRDILNYYNSGFVNHMYNMCIAHPDLGLCLRDKVVHVALGGKLWRLSAINTILYIVAFRDHLELICVTASGKRCSIKINSDSCDVEDINSNAVNVHPTLVSLYKSGCAGIEIMKQYV